MALVSNPHSAYSPRLPRLGRYSWPAGRRRDPLFLAAMEPDMAKPRCLRQSPCIPAFSGSLEDVPLVTYCHQALLGFLMVLLAPGYGKSTLAAWMMHNPASSRRWPGEVFRAWVTKFGLLVIVFAICSFCPGSYPEPWRYIFLFSSTSALPRRWRQGCCSCVTPGAWPARSTLSWRTCVFS